ncbi:MAG: hypothetical protein ACI9XO_003795, partial [Paraglaciecola sp.]
QFASFARQFASFVINFLVLAIFGQFLRHKSDKV